MRAIIGSLDSMPGTEDRALDSEADDVLGGDNQVELERDLAKEGIGAAAAPIRTKASFKTQTDARYQRRLREIRARRGARNFAFAQIWKPDPFLHGLRHIILSNNNLHLISPLIHPCYPDLNQSIQDVFPFLPLHSLETKRDDTVLRHFPLQWRFKRGE